MPAVPERLPAHLVDTLRNAPFSGGQRRSGGTTAGEPRPVRLGGAGSLEFRFDDLVILDQDDEPAYRLASVDVAQVLGADPISLDSLSGLLDEADDEWISHQGDEIGIVRANSARVAVDNRFRERLAKVDDAVCRALSRTDAPDYSLTVLDVAGTGIEAFVATPTDQAPLLVVESAPDKFTAGPLHEMGPILISLVRDEYESATGSLADDEVESEG